MASTADIRNGLIIKFNHDLYSVVEFLHVKPGKGAAFVRTKLKSVTTGKVLDNTFPSGAKLETVRVERRKYQFLYPEGDSYVFMNTESFDQTTIPSAAIQGAEFMTEGMECEVLVNTDEDRVLTAEAPIFVELEVTQADPWVKGDTVSNTLKPAVVETGATVKVPAFVEAGERIKIDTRTGEYIERVKKDK